MELKEEIALLKEKVKLLETIRDLQEKINTLERIPAYVPQPYPVPAYPGYPVYPTYPWYTTSGIAS